jgi:hypothetical protein
MNNPSTRHGVHSLRLRSRARSVLFAACCFEFLISTSCMQPVTPGQTSTPTVLAKPRAAMASESAGPLESNIVRVSKFFSSEPWLSFDDDGSGRINGFRCTVYLEGAGSPLGVFGTGTIIVAMFRLDRDPLGREIATPLQEWEMPADKAYPWRSKNRTLLGFGYGMRLRWDEQLKVAGKQVAFMVKYVRDDGHIINSSRQVLKVPLRGAAPLHASNQQITAADHGGKH